MAQPAHKDLEARIFGRFIAVEQSFGARISGDWTQPDEDPPDVRFTDKSGQEVGVELKSWMNEQQIREAKAHERLEERFLLAIGPQPKNPNKFVSLVWLRPGKGRGPDESDARAFIAELLSSSGSWR